MVTILYARRVAIVNGDTAECQALLDQACRRGNTYIFIGVKVQHEIYRSMEIRRICHLSTIEDLRSQGLRASEIIYTTGFGLRSDPILSYVTLTLNLVTTGITRIMTETVEAIRQRQGGPGTTPPPTQPERRRTNTDTVRQCRLFYNKNETSGRQIVNALTRRQIQISLGGRTWGVIRVTAREDRITQYTTTNVGAPAAASVPPATGPGDGPPGTDNPGGDPPADGDPQTFGGS